MATNDVYSPYPIGLTAAQTVEAILRAYNLTDGDFAKYQESATAPTVTKPGDIWYNTTLSTIYMAYVSGTTTVWIEV